MQRRTLFKLGLGGAVVLGLGGAGVAAWRPGLAGGRLTASGRTLFAAVARAVLDGSLPSPPEAALQAHLDRVDATIGGLPPATQADLSRLLALLGTAPGRLGLAGLTSDWPDARPADVQAALEAMRGSRFALRRQAYQALRDLTAAAYFAAPEAWSSMGYPGPDAV